MMKEDNYKAILSGIGLLLFAITMAIEGKSNISYIASGVGLFFVIGGCFLIKEN